MKRWRRPILITLVILVTLAVLAIVGTWFAVRRLAPHQIKEIIESATSTFLGRTLTIDELTGSPFPDIRLRATGVKLADKDGRVIVSCDLVTAHGSPMALLKLRLGVEEIRFEKPRIHFWYEKDGRLNIEHMVEEINARSQPSTGGGAAPRLLLHQFTVVEGRTTLSEKYGSPSLIDGRTDGFFVLTFSPLALRGMPFEVKIDEGEGHARLEAKGEVGGRGKIAIRAEHLPAAALSPRLTAIGNCTGRADARLDMETGGDPSFDFSISPAGLCSDRGDLPERVSGTVKEKDGVWVLDLSAQGAETDVAARGEIPSAPNPITFSVTGKRVDVNAISSWASAATALAKRAVPGEPVLSTAPVRALAMKVALDSATLDNIHATNIAFDVNRGTDNVVRVTPLTLNVWKGRASGVVLVRDARVEVELRGNDLSLASVNQTFSSTAQLRGLMSVYVIGSVPIGAPVISSFTGRGEVWLENFELERVPAILKAFTSANFDKIEEKIKGKKNIPFPPAKGNAQARLDGGVAEVDKLVLDNRLLRIGYTGKVNYAAQTLDGSMVVQTLTVVDQIVNDIPVLRDVFIGDGKSFFPLWFRLEGPWADPKVRPQPVRNIATPVWDIFKRVLNLPQDAYDKIRGK